MNRIGYAFVNVVETLLRMMPLPCKTGLVEVGHPGRDAPVLLTCNYHLTVERVKRALQGLDCYLLVANSRGGNVWCAAAGGLFTHHDVISALKTSGVEALVDHRTVILPQLAATGVEAQAVRERTGWKVVWGPVYAGDLPAFLSGDRSKGPAMRRVAFPLRQRIEMAAAWAFPLSVIAALALLFFWRVAILPLVLLVWGLSLLAFAAFPLYQRRLNARREGAAGPRAFDFGRGGIQLILWGLCLAVLAVLALLSGHFGWPDFLRWGAASLVVVLLVSADLAGCTPTVKGSLLPDRLLQVSLDAGLCTGCGVCVEVCPRDCFRANFEARSAAMPGALRCVQCGACIVQCPFDALSFTGPGGETIPPETIRTFKLNLMGHRAVGESPPRAGDPA